MKPLSFAWGRVLDVFFYNFDGVGMSVLKYHPWKQEGATIRVGEVNTEETLFHCKELSESFENLFELVIAFICRHQLGPNQRQLAAGVSRALNLGGEAYKGD